MRINNSEVLLSIIHLIKCNCLSVRFIFDLSILQLGFERTLISFWHLHSHTFFLRTAFVMMNSINYNKEEVQKTYQTLLNITAELVFRFSYSYYKESDNHLNRPCTLLP